MVPSPYIAIILNTTYEKLHCKVEQYYISSAVSEILRYKQTDRWPFTLLLGFTEQENPRESYLRVSSASAVNIKLWGLV